MYSASGLGVAIFRIILTQQWLVLAMSHYLSLNHVHYFHQNNSLSGINIIPDRIHARGLNNTRLGSKLVVSSLFWSRLGNIVLGRKARTMTKE